MSKNSAKYFFPSEFRGQKSDAKTYNYLGNPLEIFSGAISRSVVHKDLFNVQANTSEGLFDLIAVLNSQVDLDGILEVMETQERLRQKMYECWNTRIPNVIGVPGSPPQTPVNTSVTLEIIQADVEETADEWKSSPCELLAKLQDPSISRGELFDAILFAEIAKFDEPQTRQLLIRLFTFVNKYRLSQDEAAKTAVGAAIRKLAMNLQDSQIEAYAELFLPTETDTLPCEIELELAKAILWRLTTAPASRSCEFPKLESRLAELALDYLKPRLILQKNYASVALQAALGVLLLNGQYADSVLNSVKNLRNGWFTDLFQRRLGRLRKQFEKIKNATSTAIATNLGRFESELQGA